MFFAVAGWVVVAGAPPKSEQAALRRVVNHIVPLLVWAIVYLFVYKFAMPDQVDFRGTLAQIPFGAQRPAYHLWYLYNYIPLITIFGALMLFRAGKRPWKLVVLALVFSAGPTLAEFVKAVSAHQLRHWDWGITTYGVVYFVMGGIFLHCVARFRTGWPGRVLALAVFAVASILVFFWQTRIHYPIANLNPLTAVLGACVIVILNSIRLPERCKRWLQQAARASFGAFLIHLFFIDAYFGRWFPTDLGPAATVALFVGGLLVCFVASLTVSLLWGRIRGARKVLG